MPLDRDLHDLLFTHDCVIVPGLGGFLAHYKGARLDTHRHVVYPPGKELSFNRHLTRDDGLLTDHRAKREGTSYAEARASVGGEVSAWRERLQLEGRLELRSIGTLHTDASQNLVFQPDGRVNFLKDAHGLRPLAAVPVERAPVLEPRPAPVVRVLPSPEPAPVAEVPAAANGRLDRMWAAAALAAVLFGAATWVLYQRSDEVSWAGATWWPTREQPLFAPRTAEVPADLLVMEDEPAPAGTDPVERAPEPKETTVPVVAEAAPDTTRVAVAPKVVEARRYHVIGGCFSVQENADNFLATLRASGFDAVLVDQHHGLYRVAYGSYPDRATALEALAAVRRSGGHEAWLLKR